MGAHNGRKDQLTTHGIFRDALAGREIRLNCRQMDSAVSKIAFFQGFVQIVHSFFIIRDVLILTLSI